MKEQHEGSEVSIHLLRVFQAVRDADGWVTSQGVADAANVKPRTARSHLIRLVRLGIVDQAEVFPGHRYRMSSLAEKRNKAFMQRMAKAAEVFGETAE